jgi:hypothetical protein
MMAFRKRRNMFQWNERTDFPFVGGGTGLSKQTASGSCFVCRILPVPVGRTNSPLPAALWVPSAGDLVVALSPGYDQAFQMSQLNTQ